MTLPYGSGVRFVSSRLTPDEREMFPQMSSHVCIDLPAGRRLCVSPSEEDADLIAGALNALYSASRTSRADSRHCGGAAVTLLRITCVAIAVICLIEAALCVFDGYVPSDQHVAVSALLALAGTMLSVGNMWPSK